MSLARVLTRPFSENLPQADGKLLGFQSASACPTMKLMEWSAAFNRR